MHAKFDFHRPTLAALAAACALAFGSGAAHAGAVTASFSGNVTGVMFDSRVLADYPVGTAVSWQFSFDDAFLALRANVDDVFGGASQAITGTATVGADVYALNFARLYSYQYDGNTGDVLSYQFQVEGTGPQSASGGDFFGVWARFDPALALFESRVGYGFTSNQVTNYGYLEMTGDYRLTRNSVTAPATVWLALPALAWVLGRRRVVRS